MIEKTFRVRLADAMSVYSLPWKKAWFIIELILIFILVYFASLMFFENEEILEGWLLMACVPLIFIVRYLICIVLAKFLLVKNPRISAVCTYIFDMEGFC